MNRMCVRMIDQCWEKMMHICLSAGLTEAQASELLSLVRIHVSTIANSQFMSLLPSQPEMMSILFSAVDSEAILTQLGVDLRMSSKALTKCLLFLTDQICEIESFQHVVNTKTKETV